MPIKAYLPLRKSPELEPHHQMQFSVVLRIPPFLVGVITPLQRINSAYSKLHRQGDSDDLLAKLGGYWSARSAVILLNTWHSYNGRRRGYGRGGSLWSNGVDFLVSYEPEVKTNKSKMYGICPRGTPYNST